MADAQDLKSCGRLLPCGFESRSGYSWESRLEPREHGPDLFRAPQIRNRVRNRIVVPQPQQGRQLLLIQLVNPLGHVVPKHEFQERLLLRVELARDH
jgi:hypothetical protein